MSAEIQELLREALEVYRVEVERNNPDKEAEKRRLMEEIKPALPERVREYLHLAPRYDGGWYFFMYIPGCFPIQLQFRRQLSGMEFRSATVLDANSKGVWFSRQLLPAIGKARELMLNCMEAERVLVVSDIGIER